MKISNTGYYFGQTFRRPAGELNSGSSNYKLGALSTTPWNQNKSKSKILVNESQTLMFARCNAYGTKILILWKTKLSTIN